MDISSVFMILAKLPAGSTFNLAGEFYTKTENAGFVIMNETGHLFPISWLLTGATN